MSAVRNAKKNLRSVMRETLKTLSNESIRSQSSTICQTVLGLGEYQAAKRLGVYLSMPAAEVQTDSIVRAALAAGKEVYVPFMLKSTVAGRENINASMDLVRLVDVEEYESLGRDGWGIPSIDPSDKMNRRWVLRGKQRLDLLLMPGVAFERHKEDFMIRRLGHGKGFYDKFLDEYRRKLESPSARLPLYGLAFSEQYWAEQEEAMVPVDERDVLIDGVVLGDGRVIQAVVD